MQALLKEKGEASSSPAADNQAGAADGADGSQQEKEAQVEKVYRCLSAAPPPVGRLMHWVETNVRQPGT
jgi:hypothetical protein